MRWIVLLALALWGCSDLSCGLGTVQDGFLCVPSIGVTGPLDTSDTAFQIHPNVPPGYEYLWNTDACTRRNGKSGNQVYKLAEGRIEADGTVSITERWYWFWKDPGWEGDCIDTIQINGSPMAQDMGAMGCSVCDEGFQGRRQVIENNCGVHYEDHFVEGRHPNEANFYPGIFMFDTITPSGTPNVDNAMLVFVVNADKNGDFSSSDVQTDYAAGHVFPDDPDTAYGYPGDYDWLGSGCY